MSLEAVRHAERVWSTKSQLTRQQLVDEVVSMHEWGVFSNRHLSKITGLRPAFVNELTGKTSRTGGTINPARLGEVAKVIEANNRGEDVREYVTALLGEDEGFSSIMLSRLTGLPQSTLSRWARG